MGCITVDLFAKRQVTGSLTLFATLLLCIFSIIMGVYISPPVDFVSARECYSVNAIMQECRESGQDQLMF